MTKTMQGVLQGVLIGLATALLGVLLTQVHTDGLLVIGRATVVTCNR
ncbi:hypothetical protein [Dactylosporangium sp. CS-033363]